ncbi:MAG TPA: hypothetical protein VJ461_06445 [Candidatus Nanoarchaeia archaeon]|nr:hypothetical protein [Candidatus Nanoarchaeia archaeon]
MYIWEIFLMECAYLGKPIFPTKEALTELSNLNLDLYDVQEILENGFHLRKRKKNITEKALRKGNKIINVVVVELGNYYKLIHVGRFSVNKKFKQAMQEEKNGL